MPLTTEPSLERNSGTRVSTTLRFIYFSGNNVVMVASTCPAFTSNGVGTTVNLSADKLFNLEQDVKRNKVETEIVRMAFLDIGLMF